MVRSAVTAAGRLRAAGARAVVVSLGAAGLLAVTAEGNWRAVPPHRVSGNPTGAGDAVVAALAHGLVLGRSWPERLGQAVALGAAAAAAPAAGEFRAADYQRALAGASTTHLEEDRLAEDGLAEHDLAGHDLAEHGLAGHGLAENGLAQNRLAEDR